VISAVILAGGLGTRLRSVVPDLPKPMAMIAGRPFLEHQLDYWIKQGIEHFILSVGYRYEVITKHFGSNYKNAVIEYVIEYEPLGTGGGLMLAVEKMNKQQPFLLLNGDTYFEVDLKALIEFASLNDADWCFSLFSTHEEGRYMGMDVSQQGQIESLKSDTAQPRRLANGGVYLVNPRSLSNINITKGDKVSLEDDIFPAVIDAGQRLFGIEFLGDFIDIGVPDDYYRAQTLLN